MRNHLGQIIDLRIERPLESYNNLNINLTIRPQHQHQLQPQPQSQPTSFRHPPLSKTYS